MVLIGSDARVEDYPQHRLFDTLFLIKWDYYKFHPGKQATAIFIQLVKEYIYLIKKNNYCYFSSNYQVTKAKMMIKSNQF